MRGSGASVQKRGMKTLRTLCLLPVAALAVATGLSDAFALPSTNPGLSDVAMKIDADCYSIGEQVASQQGGTLARASQSKRGGRTVCVIVVLVPGRDGQRPRRAEIVVPAN